MSQNNGINELTAAYQADRPELSTAPAPAAYQEAPQSLVSSDPVQQLLANLDLWTGTVTDKSGGRGRGSNKGTELTGIKKLRELILELAVRGKLVPPASRKANNRANDEPASALLKRIEAEKARLVKDGKIKKPKKLPPISDDEKPFQLPDGWEWVRIAAISDVGTGATPARGNPEYYEPAEFHWVTSGETSNPFVSATKEKISAKAVAETNVTICPVGTLIIAMYGQGKTRGQITELLIPAGTNQACATIQLFEKSPTHRTYIKRFFEKAYDDIRSIAEGGAQPNLNVGKVATTVIPLPPLAEQQRIVARVDKLMALCDQLEQGCLQQLDNHQQLVDTLLAELTATRPSPASDSSHDLPLSDSAAAITSTSAGPDAPEHNSAWQRIHDQFDRLFTGAIQTAFPPLKTKGQTAGQAELVEAQSILVGAGNSDWAIDRLKETILQLAVMGRLVEQNKNDEPASALLKRIDAEKAQQVKDGKIKKPAKLPPISDDEQPFQLPEGWEWCRIGQISLSCDYGTSVKSSAEGEGIPVVSMGQIQSGEVSLNNLKVIPNETPDIEQLLLNTGDLLYNRTNSAELVGKTGLFDGASERYTYASYLIRIRLPGEQIDSKYINSVMNSPNFRRVEIDPHIKQQCGQANVNGTIMQQMRIPLPPLAEQQRIVERVDQLFALCDQLKAKQQAANQTRQQLTETLVERVLG
jgi:type I restriction enzyme, S subunit